MIIVRICGDLSIEDGSVNTGLSVEGVIANYICDVGFELVGNVERECQSNGLWSGMNPACQGMSLSMVITGYNIITVTIIIIINLLWLYILELEFHILFNTNVHELSSR